MTPSNGASGVQPTVPELFQMMLAYKKTAVVRTAIELGIFGSLADGPATARTVAAAKGLDERGTRLLLNALAAIGLLDAVGEQYQLTSGAATHLVPGHPGYVGGMAKVLASTWEWDAMWRLPEAVRRGGTVAPENAETPGYKYWEDFAAFAGTVAEPTARLMADVLDGWARNRQRLDLLDMACGHGLYGYTLARRHPTARVWSLDWDNVLPIAQKHAARLGIADRVSTIAGDMFSVPLGGPYDIVMVTNVLHHFSQDHAVRLLRRAASVTVSGGRIALVGHTVDDGPPRESAEAHLFSILMLAWTAQGETHSAVVYERMLTEAGYTNTRVHRQTALPLRVIVADKP